ncbi:MAG: RluA family pseudouridine synthase [Isosphaeraceae bacterium]
MLQILYEDNHCLVVDKPAGLLSQGDETGVPSLLDQAAAYLKAKYHKPGNVYIGLVHRLDQPASGAVLLARTSKAASRLSDQFRRGLVRKMYWAIVEGMCPENEVELRDTLWKNEATNTVSVVSPATPGGRDAVLRYHVLERNSGRSLLEVDLVTGRSHQIRVQLASRGFPLVGDRKYGARSALQALDGHPRIALHSRSIAFSHPTKGEEIAVTCEAPADWPWRSP